MEIGKIPNSILRDLIKNDFYKEEIIVGPGIGKDVSIIDLRDDYMVISADPITGATKDIGSLAVNVSSNDLATVGATPVAVILTVLAPPGTTVLDLENIMEDAKEASRKLGISIAGGHTEITDAVTRVLISSVAIGKVSEFKLEKINIGDLIVVSKDLALEGTSIIAKESRECIEFLDSYELEEAKSLSDYLSVIDEGIIGREYGAKYMHDITEGGVLGAAWEASEANGVGVLIYDEKLPFRDVTLKIADYFKIDARKLISSGSMLFIFSPESYENAKIRFNEKNIKTTIIGEVVNSGVNIEDKEGIKPVDEPESDHLYQVL